MFCFPLPGGCSLGLPTALQKFFVSHIRSHLTRAQTSTWPVPCHLLFHLIPNLHNKQEGVTVLTKQPFWKGNFQKKTSPRQFNNSWDSNTGTPASKSRVTSLPTATRCLILLKPSSVIREWVEEEFRNHWTRDWETYHSGTRERTCPNVLSFLRFWGALDNNLSFLSFSK